MKKGWKVIIVIVLIAVLLGMVCFGVGMMTGADMERIYSVMDNKYHIEAYYQYAQQVWQAILDANIFG